MELLVTIALAAAAAAGLDAPSATDLAAAIHAAPRVSGRATFRIDTIRLLRCKAFEEESTEYLCRFRARTIEGRWNRRSAILARDGPGWILLSLD